MIQTQYDMQMMKKDRLMVQGIALAIIVALISIGSVAVYNQTYRTTGDVPQFSWEGQSGVSLSGILQEQDDQLLALISDTFNQTEHPACGPMAFCEQPYPFFQGNISEYFTFRVNYSNTTKAWRLEMTEYKSLPDNKNNHTSSLTDIDRVDLQPVNDALYTDINTIVNISNLGVNVSNSEEVSQYYDTYVEPMQDIYGMIELGLRLIYDNGILLDIHAFYNPLTPEQPTTTFIHVVPFQTYRSFIDEDGRESIGIDGIYTDHIEYYRGYTDSFFTNFATQGGLFLDQYVA